MFYQELGNSAAKPEEIEEIETKVNNKEDLMSVGFMFKDFQWERR
jgi:hypothetical protein